MSVDSRLRFDQVQAVDSILGLTNGSSTSPAPLSVGVVPCFHSGFRENLYIWRQQDYTDQLLKAANGCRSELCVAEVYMVDDLGPNALESKNWCPYNGCPDPLSIITNDDGQAMCSSCNQRAHNACVMQNLPDAQRQLLQDEGNAVWVCRPCWDAQHVGDQDNTVVEVEVDEVKVLQNSVQQLSGQMTTIMTMLQRLGVPTTGGQPMGGLAQASTATSSGQLPILATSTSGTVGGTSTTVGMGRGSNFGASIPGSSLTPTPLFAQVGIPHVSVTTGVTMPSPIHPGFGSFSQAVAGAAPPGGFLASGHQIRQASAFKLPVMEKYEGKDKQNFHSWKFKFEKMMFAHFGMDKREWIFPLTMSVGGAAQRLIDMTIESHARRNKDVAYDYLVQKLKDSFVRPEDTARALDEFQKRMFRKGEGNEEENPQKFYTDLYFLATRAFEMEDSALESLVKNQFLLRMPNKCADIFRGLPEMGIEDAVRRVSAIWEAHRQQDEDQKERQRQQNKNNNGNKGNKFGFGSQASGSNQTMRIHTKF